MSSRCVQCSQAYEIAQEDLAFYESISPTFVGRKFLIPPPTLCPDCRVQRRMAWRNDRTFYRRTCDLTGALFVSMYAPDAPFPVYRQDAWHSDKWDGLEYGRPFDFSRPFFDQWAELNHRVPHWGVAISNCENSDYCNYCNDEKNCYLDIAAEANEDCYYNHFTKYSKNCVDCAFVYRSQLCYECMQCYDCYACRYGQYLENCSDCAFCFDCKSCKNCLFCMNLRNKEYCIHGKQHSQKEYRQKLEELSFGSYSAIQRSKELWRNALVENGVFRGMYMLNCEGCVGNDLQNSKNCRWCFNAVNCEDCKYLYDVLDAKNCYDMNYSPYGPEACYEVTSTIGLKYSAFYMAGPYNTSCFYSHMLLSCSDCFGCIGLKHKQYCVFNRQYTKGEYEQLAARIIGHMLHTKEYGEFFPVHLSPHGYNETVAQEHCPLAREEVERRGWKWRERSDEPLQVEKAILAERLPDAVEDIPDDVCNWAIECEVTKRPFKIIKQELDFYRNQKLPIPRRHPDQRHSDRMALRNPRKLWKRECMKCGKDMQTTYSPERLEKVYCENCYLDDVY